MNEDYIGTLMGSSATIILEEILSCMNVDFSKKLIEKLAKKRAKIES